MKKSSTILYVILTIVLLIECKGFSSISKSPDVLKTQIMSKTRDLKAGDPLVVELSVELISPNVQPDSNSVYPNWIHDGSFKISIFGEGQNSVEILKAFPLSLSSLDMEGLKYGTSFTLFYDYGTKKLLFNKSGTYFIQFIQSGGSSNIIEISVNDQIEQIKNLISLLSDPNDYLFLESGSNFDKSERQERISHLQKIVERGGDTILAKWASARLGLEEFNTFHKEHPSFQKFKTMREQNGTESFAFNQVDFYFSKAVTLPDEFPIRQDVLERLVTVEYIKGNYEKANSLIDEAAQKYPNSKLGKRSQKTKEELRKIKEKEEQDKRKKGNSAEPNSP